MKFLAFYEKKLEEAYEIKYSIVAEIRNKLTEDVDVEACTEAYFSNAELDSDGQQDFYVDHTFYTTDDNGYAVNARFKTIKSDGDVICYDIVSESEFTITMRYLTFDQSLILASLLGRLDFELGLFVKE